MREIREQLVTLYSRAVDDLLSAYPEDADVGELEAQVEKLTREMLPVTSSSLARRQEGAFLAPSQRELAEKE
jgi:ATP-dependent Lon protease